MERTMFNCALLSANSRRLLVLLSAIVAFGFLGLSKTTTAGAAPKGKKVIETKKQGEVPLIPRRILFGNPDKASARISPDGSRLAYLAPVNGVLNVWVGPGLKPDEAKPVTDDKKRGIRSYFWAYTNNHIL